MKDFDWSARFTLFSSSISQIQNGNLILSLNLTNNNNSNNNNNNNNGKDENIKVEMSVEELDRFIEQLEKIKNVSVSFVHLIYMHTY